MRKLNRTFGKQLREARHSAGLSQAALAKLSKTEEARLSSYEHGRYLPAADTLVSLAKALHVSVDYLLGRTG